MQGIDKILVTGGAGFIGSHLIDMLLEKDYHVIALDILDSQVHGQRKTPPPFLNSDAEFIYGNISKRGDIASIIKDVDGVFHLAAAVGVGQSMYEPEYYIRSNTLGTAVLLDLLVNEEHDVKKLIVASSMSIYGEGKYVCEHDGPVYPKLRSEEQLEKKEWDSKCPICGAMIKPVPTDEEKPLHPTSIYAMSKRHQEEMCLLIGEAYGIPSVALRYFNAYGPRQSLSNPYTGVVAIFSSRILNNNPPIVYEDGNQRRDFIHVKDIGRASLLAFEKSVANYKYYNVGSGSSISIIELAKLLINLYGKDLKPLITEQFRTGDIRHCYSDNSKIKKDLGFEPQINFETGLKELANWVETQEKIDDKFQTAEEELKTKGLIK